jgi:hypothetical protein
VRATSGALALLLAMAAALALASRSSAPESPRLLYKDVVEGIATLRLQGGVLTAQQKASVKKGARNWFLKIDYTSPGDVRVFADLMGSGWARELFGKLDQEQLAETFAALFEKLEATLPLALEDIEALIRDINTGELNERWGLTVNVAFGHATAVFKVEEYWPDRLPKPRSGTPAFGRRFSADDARLVAKRKALEDRVAWLNAVPRVLVNILPLIDSAPAPSLEVMNRQLEHALRGHKPVELLAHLRIPPSAGHKPGPGLTH